MARTVGIRSTLLLAVAGAVLAVGTFAGSSGGATSSVSTIEPASLARAQTIRDSSTPATARWRPRTRRHRSDLDSRRRVVRAPVADLLARRFIPAANGIWYAICPVGATCPYPAHRSARPAAALAPRRLALELALRTFLRRQPTSLRVASHLAFHRVRRRARGACARGRCPCPGEALDGDPGARSPHAQRRRPVTRPRVFLSWGSSRPRVDGIVGRHPSLPSARSASQPGFTGRSVTRSTCRRSALSTCPSRDSPSRRRASSRSRSSRRRRGGRPRRQPRRPPRCGGGTERAPRTSAPSR